jgi:hypothetical protein
MLFARTAGIAVFYSLAEYSDENMMDASNLASCLAPSLMPIPEEKDQVQYVTHTIELLRTMIIHHDEILPSDGNGPVYEKFLLVLPMYVSLPLVSSTVEYLVCLFREGEEDDETSERSLRRSASDEGKTERSPFEHQWLFVSFSFARFGLLYGRFESLE